MPGRWPSARGKDLGKGRRGRKEKCSHLSDSLSWVPWCSLPPRTWSKVRHISPTCHFPAGQRTYIKRGWLQGAGRLFPPNWSSWGNHAPRTRTQLGDDFFHGSIFWRFPREICPAHAGPYLALKATPYSWVSHHDRTVAPLLWQQKTIYPPEASSKLRRWSGWRRKRKAWTAEQVHARNPC